MFANRFPSLNHFAVCLRSRCRMKFAVAIMSVLLLSTIIAVDGRAGH